MRATIFNPAPYTRNALLLAMLCLPCAAQTPALPDAPNTSQGDIVDRVIAVVNGDLILESDVDEERRFEAFQPLSRAGETFSRDKAVERLVDRQLILQQAAQQNEGEVSDDEVTKQLADLRKDIPACRQFHCDTDAGWKKFVEAQGFTVDELNDKWKERMTVLKFIELRFRMGIRITPVEIKAYYDKTLLPAYAAQKAPPPKLDDISDRIQEILLQQRVGDLLDEWLKSLRAQGSVRMIKSGEVMP